MPLTLFLFLVQLSRTAMQSPNTGHHSESQLIAFSFLSALSANLRGGTPCGFLSVKRKLRKLSSPLKQLFSFQCFLFHTDDSHFTGVKPPKTFPSVSAIKVRVFARPSQRRWNSFAPKPSRLPRHSSSASLPENSC
jgi:hypothetical protein